jgi:hypothetical protein
MYYYFFFSTTTLIVFGLKNMWIENEINNNKSLIRTRIKITTADKSEEEIKKKNQPKTYRVPTNERLQ